MVFLIIVRLVLIAVFITSGIAKFIDPKGTLQALKNFGLPKQLSRFIFRTLPLLEITTAIMLLFQPTSWIGGVLCLGLLFVFTIVISYNLIRGRSPTCHCFGQLHSQPIGRGTLIRNILLLMLAVSIVWQGPFYPFSGIDQWLYWLRPLSWGSLLAGLVIAVVLFVQGWFILHLIQQQGRLLTRIDALEMARPMSVPMPVRPPAAPSGGLPVGSVAPKFNLPGLDQVSISLDKSLRQEKPVMLIFIDPDCGPCNALLPDVSRWQKKLSYLLTIYLISRGSLAANRNKRREFDLKNILLQKDYEVMRAYQATATPSAVLIGTDGLIQTKTGVGADDIGALIQMVGESDNLIAERKVSDERVGI